MLYALICLLWSAGLPIAPILKVDDTLAFGQDRYLTSPMSAIYINEHLYVADEGQPILVFGKTGFLRTIGAVGGAGDEFKFQPVHLSVRNHDLVILERHGRSQSRFSQQGVFISKETMDPGIQILSDGTRFRHLTRPEVLSQGHLLKEETSGLFYGTLDSDPKYGIHFSQIALRLLDPHHILLVRTRGMVEIYDRKASLRHKQIIPLELYKRDVIPNRKKNWLANAVKANRTFFKFGRPLIAVAVEGPKQIWFLIAHEQSMGEDEGTPTEVSLFRMNIWTGDISFKAKAHLPFTGLSIDDDHLVLRDRQHAVIEVYSLSAFRQVLN